MLTPGHRPGYVGVEIRSHGQHAVITGDAITHPVQLDDPQGTGNFGTDRAPATTTRGCLHRGLRWPWIAVFGIHCSTPASARRIVTGGEGWRSTPTEATVDGEDTRDHPSGRCRPGFS